VTDVTRYIDLGLGGYLRRFFDIFIVYNLSMAGKIRNPFSLVRHLFIKTDGCEYADKPRETRIISGTPTEFIFCNRKFGAVIIDASNSGMKLCCDIRLGIGSIITLVEPAICGRIVWRDDENNLMGVMFVSKESLVIVDDDPSIMGCVHHSIGSDAA
jgi:hypothetical protein